MPQAPKGAAASSATGSTPPAIATDVSDLGKALLVRLGTMEDVLEDATDHGVDDADDPGCSMERAAARAR